MNDTDPMLTAACSLSLLSVHPSDACFSLVEPTPVLNPRLVSHSSSALRLLDLADSEVDRPDFADYFSGNKHIPGTRPAAHTYCGHQFGHFSGQLGDGAAMYLGEVMNHAGERIELQFKGAGLTPYSRSADGRKVLRSSIREFICSEAHHALGIPTTRAGTIVTSDTRVVRDILYDGNPIEERATIITRLAPSFLRFGSFELAKAEDSITGRAGPSAGRHDLIQQMLDYVIATFYADATRDALTQEDKYIAFFRELARRTANLVAQWQSVGWCHGVLNTDNMSILGLTIDYGPFGFMEHFDPEYICNGSDTEGERRGEETTWIIRQTLASCLCADRSMLTLRTCFSVSPLPPAGRYRYESQPEICGWNLLKLSQNFESFAPKDRMREVVGEFEDMYDDAFLKINLRKFGVGALAAETSSATRDIAAAAVESKEKDESEANSDANAELIGTFYATLAATGGDFTNCFRCLSSFDADDLASAARTINALVASSATVTSQLSSLVPRIPAHQWSMIQHLLTQNPHLFDRPGMEEQRAIVEQETTRRAARAALEKKTQAMKTAEDRDQWSAWVALYGRVLTRAQSAAAAAGRLSEWRTARRRMQNGANPKYILRNWIAQEVIAAAESGDFEPMRACMKRLEDPYDVDDRGDAPTNAEQHGGATTTRDETNTAPTATCARPVWSKERPDWANSLKVTCSS